MRRALFPASLAVAAIALVLSGLPVSPGTALRDVASGYSGSLAGEHPDSARSFMTDSLAGLVSPGLLLAAPAPPPGGALRTGRGEARGFQVSLQASEGGASRTIWLRRDGDTWAVSGDTWLDGLLGSAAMICRDYAVSILPLVSSGRPAGEFSCPVSGLPYFLDDSTGDLECPSGHLGEGLGTGSGRCGGRRAEVASTVGAYVSAGYGFPSSIEEMWQASAGEFGQRGGYRCPDNGYSYYELRDSTVWCPFHQAGTAVPGTATPAAGAGP